MNIVVRYFASVREKLGERELLDLTGAGEPNMPRTVGELHTWLTQRSPEHAAALHEDKGLRTAFNQTLCAADQPLVNGAEVAFFPPVTGG